MKKIVLYIILLILAQTVISGFITNEQTGETLIGANVFIPEMKIGITSDKNGFYSILIEETELKEFEIIIQYSITFIKRRRNEKRRKQKKNYLR